MVWFCFILRSEILVLLWENIRNNFATTSETLINWAFFAHQCSSAYNFLILFCILFLQVNQWTQFDTDDTTYAVDGNGDVLSLYDFQGFNKNDSFLILLLNIVIIGEH